jgi:hypothetical protein
VAIETEDRLDIIWGAPQIARYINKPVPATYRLLEAGQLPARKNGKLWTSTKRELREALTTDAPVSKTTGGA